MTSFSQVVEFIHGIYPDRDFIPLHEPHFGGKEKVYLNECIDSTYVSSVGKFVDHFEEIVRDYTLAKYTVATVNGTAALHIALLLAGVRPGDLVLTQPLTFIATCNAISYCGAEPVFIDVERNTLGMSPEALEVWLKDNPGLNSRVKACIPMNTFGHPCRLDRIIEVCARFQIPVVEDAAESLGSYYKGSHTGIRGKLGILSFNGNKTITTGGGGMILTNEEDLGKLAKHITTTAKKPHPWNFEHDMIGYNYRLPNINAALGCAQMEQLPEILANKRELAHKYKAFFDTMPDMEFIIEPADSHSNYWLNAILLPDRPTRDDFLLYTNNHRVMTRPAWTLMNKLPIFKSAICGNLPVAEDIESRLVNIPSSVNLKR